MKMPSILQFVIEAAPEGGYTAEAVGFSIHTQGETLDETVRNINEAAECHFSEEEINKHPVPIMVNFALPTFA